MTGFKVEGEGNCLSDCAVCGSIEKTEFEWRNGVGGKRVFIHKVHVYEIAGRAGVY